MQITITGISPNLDGTYELPAPMTTRELHEVKTVSGIRPIEIGDAYASGDAAFKAVMAVIALRRAGKHAPIDVFLDASYEQTAFVFPGLDKLLEGDAADPTTRKPSAGSGRRSRSSSASPVDGPKASGGQT